MLINLLKEKTIVYDVDTVENILEVNFVILLDQHVIYPFKGEVDKNNKTIIINLPPLKDIIKEETTGECYLEIQDINNRFYKIEKDKIEFKNIPVVALKFHKIDDQVPSASRREVDEIFLTGKRVVTEKRRGPIPRNTIPRNK